MGHPVYVKKNLIKFKLDNYPLILMTIFLSSDNKPSPLIGWLTTAILRFCNGQISQITCQILFGSTRNISHEAILEVSNHNSPSVQKLFTFWNMKDLKNSKFCFWSICLIIDLLCFDLILPLYRGRPCDAHTANFWRILKVKLLCNYELIK